LRDRLPRIGQPPLMEFWALVGIIVVGAIVFGIAWLGRRR
jgi:hypothetical protein